MARGKSNPKLQQLATIAIYVFLVLVVGTYFLPTVSVNLPAFGKKSWSVRDIVRVIPKGMQKEEKRKPLTAEYDFMDLVKELAPRRSDTKAPINVYPEIILGALVPVSLALAYLLSLLNFLISPLKKGFAFLTASALAAVCSCYALLGVYLLGQSAQRAFSNSLAKVEDSPFSVIAKSLLQEVSIQPDTGLFVLVIATTAVLLLSLYRMTQSAK